MVKLVVCHISWCTAWKMCSFLTTNLVKTRKKGIQPAKLASYGCYTTKSGFQWQKIAVLFPCTPFFAHSIPFCLDLFHAISITCMLLVLRPVSAPAELGSRQSLWRYSVRKRRVGVKIQEDRKSLDDRLWYCCHVLILAYIVGLTHKKSALFNLYSYHMPENKFCCADTWRQSFLWDYNACCGYWL